jgi:hypothetical protein
LEYAGQLYDGRNGGGMLAMREQNGEFKFIRGQAQQADDHGR